MELGEKLKQARLEAGLSQRQLCEGIVTRNMLSQIENGSARPSMATLRHLAEKLGKSLSFFLEEDAVTSPNQTVMERARLAFHSGNEAQIPDILAQYREPDPVFDLERQLLARLGLLKRAEHAVKDGKLPYAAELLEQYGPFREGYCAEELERKRLMLLARAKPQLAAQLAAQLPSMEGELLLRARACLAQKAYDRAASLLDAAEDREDPHWNFLRGEVYFAGGDYEQAAAYYLKAEPADPESVMKRLERCYRETGNFERAYYYACALRDGRKR